MTIKEFARKIGVSTTTVSSAVTGNGRISESTREMVLAKAKELGYTPNLNARRLVSGRSYLVALTALEQELASDLFTMQVARAMTDPLKANGYDLWLNLAPDSTREHAMLRQLVKSNTVDGTIVICGQDIPSRLFHELASKKHPCVAISRTPIKGIPYTGSVVINLRTGVQQVAKMLVENGHRRIGFIDSNLLDEISANFIEELGALGIQFMENDYIAASGNNVEDGSNALHALMSQSKPPSAVFARTDILAVGALREARRKGLVIGQDISIVGHDDLSLLTLAEPDLTTVRIDYTELAETTATILSQMLHDSETNTPPHVNINTTLIMRGTVGRQVSK